MMPVSTRREMPWFFNPRFITAGVLLPAYLLIWFIANVLEVRLSTAKGFFFFQGEAFLLGLAGLLALIYGTFLPVNVFAIVNPRRLGLVPPLWFVQMVGGAALVGYAYWFRELLANPEMLLNALSGGGAISYELRGNLERSAGLASLATLGLAYFALLAHRVWVVRLGPLSVPMKLFTGLLFFLTVFRAFAWSERLALFEALLVVAIFWVGFSDRASRGWLGRIRPMLPVIAVVIVVVFFGVAEYFRSWSSFYAKTESNFWAFIVQRLINYYAQALNTGAGLVTMLDWPSYQFGYLLEWMQKFPILMGPIMRYLTELQPNYFLERFGDPEFNNPSGIFSVLYDVGLGPAIAVFALTGLLAQSAFRAFQDRDNVFGLFYPVFFMALVEMFRYWYLGNSRTFLFVIALVLGVMLAQPIRKPQPSGLATIGYA